MLDKVTNLLTNVIEEYIIYNIISLICSIKSFTPNQKYTDIVSQFSKVIVSQFFTVRSCEHKTEYFIKTKGLPVFEEPW